MRNKLLSLFKLLFLLSISCNTVFCQNRNIKISCVDSKNAYSKKLFLLPKFDMKYYTNHLKQDTAALTGRQFEFNIHNEKDDFPRPYHLSLEVQEDKTYLLTESFYFENKPKNIIFDSENGKIIDPSESTALREETFSYEKYMDTIITQKKKLDCIKFDSYKNNSFRFIKDSLHIKYDSLKLNEQRLLLNYSRLHPNSAVLFWKIVELTETNGYDKKYEGIFNHLSKKIKASAPAKVLQKQFAILKQLNIGNRFTLKIKNRNITVSKRFTLIDFWFSHCKPCLEQIPKYKHIYEKYRSKGFGIIAISTDKTTDTDDWKKVIHDNNLTWPQFLDENGTESKKHNITAFPTTFLLDSHGIILRKNISPEELEKFCEQNLN